MLQQERNNQLVVVTTTYKNGKCDVFIPDMHITVHGDDALSALAEATATATALYFYHADRGVRLPLTTTYSQAEELCTRKESFPTYLALLT